MHGVSLWMWYI